jgi:hypothetical protein
MSQCSGSVALTALLVGRVGIMNMMLQRACCPIDAVRYEQGDARSSAVHRRTRTAGLETDMFVELSSPLIRLKFRLKSPKNIHRVEPPSVTAFKSSRAQLTEQLDRIRQAVTGPTSPADVVNVPEQRLRFCVRSNRAGLFPTVHVLVRLFTVIVRESMRTGGFWPSEAVKTT